jgi:DNA helicase HerA-like ATPase
VDGAALDLGRGVLDGATGTGKTKTLQGLAEQLSDAGVPVFVADVKGDLSGLAAPGDAGSAAAKRAQAGRASSCRKRSSAASSACSRSDCEPGPFGQKGLDAVGSAGPGW